MVCAKHGMKRPQQVDKVFIPAPTNFTGIKFNLKAIIADIENLME